MTARDIGRVRVRKMRPPVFGILRYITDSSAESSSMELFKTALRLARHRELVDGFDHPDIAQRRSQFAEEIATAIRRVNTIAELARAR